MANLILNFPETVDSCSCKDLLPAAACFRDPVSNTIQRKAIQIVLLNYIIKQFESAEDVYSMAELLEKGKCCSCGIEKFDREAMYTYMLWVLAVEISDTEPSGSTLVDEACKLQCGGADLDAILVELWCEFLKSAGTMYSTQ